VSLSRGTAKGVVSAAMLLRVDPSGPVRSEGLLLGLGASGRLRLLQPLPVLMTLVKARPSFKAS